jgi:hypothetical protein
LLPASADLREHACDDAEISFVTGLKVCPICRERLDVRPSFPSSVRNYLKRTRAANKVYVTFDYETELFVLIEDGEFVVVSNNDDSGRTFLVPRSGQLSAPRDFYELYQDYYHCADPQSGEINIAEPALVVEKGDGWKFEAAGILLVVGEAGKTQVGHKPSAFARETRAVQADYVAQPAEARVDQKVVPVTTETSAVAPCKFCETLIEAKYAFCWKCGHPRGSKAPGPGLHPERSRVLVSMEDDLEEIPEEKNSSQPRLSWASTLPLQRSTKSSRGILKLFSIVVAGLLFGFLSLVALLRSNATVPATTTDQPVTPAVQTSTTAPNSEPAPTAEMKPVAAQIPASTSEDTELERLRQMRTAANASDRSKILRSFAETERKYARDYRFPYERARVVVGLKKNFREEAFAALARAAQKAIDSGKAVEMLQSLNKDKDGDFQKLSHDRREWSQLQKALKNKDVRGLDVEAGF